MFNKLNPRARLVAHAIGYLYDEYLCADRSVKIREQRVRDLVDLAQSVGITKEDYIRAVAWESDLRYAREELNENHKDMRLKLDFDSLWEPTRVLVKEAKRDRR